jgi:hypothetical protein
MLMERKGGGDMHMSTDRIEHQKMDGRQKTSWTYSSPKCTISTTLEFILLRISFIGLASACG